MQVDKLGIKFFVAEPGAVSLKKFVPIFHTWIQRQSIEGHLLIDVHDYSHVPFGPGILLVAHEGNFSIDLAEGRPGLLYYRKQPLRGADEDRLASILKAALQGCSLLENDPSLETKIRFRTDEAFIVANDRLQAPNVSQTFSDFSPVVTSVWRKLAQGSDITVAPGTGSPKDRFSIRVEVKSPPDVKALLDRIPLVWSGYYSGGL
jgi:hypothetical protein